jgi:hypothetical protein
MNIRTGNLFTCLGVASRAAWVLPALRAALGFLLTGPVTAQTFTNLHNFSAAPYPPGTNIDGIGPDSGMVSSGTHTDETQSLQIDILDS